MEFHGIDVDLDRLRVISESEMTSIHEALLHPLYCHPDGWPIRSVLSDVYGPGAKHSATSTMRALAYRLGVHTVAVLADPVTRIVVGHATIVPYPTLASHAHLLDFYMTPDTCACAGRLLACLLEGRTAPTVSYAHVQSARKIAILRDLGLRPRGDWPVPGGIPFRRGEVCAMLNTELVGSLAHDQAVFSLDDARP